MTVQQNYYCTRLKYNWDKIYSPVATYGQVNQSFGVLDAPVVKHS